MQRGPGNVGIYFLALALAVGLANAVARTRETVPALHGGAGVRSGDRDLRG